MIDYGRVAHEVLASAQSIGQLRLQVISDSMRPILRRGDIVLVESIEPAAAHVGDVVVVQCGAELITHRLIDKAGEGWVLRGDNAIFADAPISSIRCLGRVIAVERGANPIDLMRPPWLALNRRLGQTSRIQWNITHRLRLSASSSRGRIRLAWLIALPFRVAARLMVAGAKT